MSLNGTAGHSIGNFDGLSARATYDSTSCASASAAGAPGGRAEGSAALALAFAGAFAFGGGTSPVVAMRLPKSASEITAAALCSCS